MGMILITDELEARQAQKPVDKELEIVRLQAVNRMLVAACFEALEFRGLMTALHDPLMLDGEKKEVRERWKKIELSIRAAIERADNPRPQRQFKAVNALSKSNKADAGNQSKNSPTDYEIEKYF